MALRLKTVEYPFPTNTGTLATNTTLGTATRYDFSAITLDIPETTSRTFRSVVIQLGFRDAMTTIYSFTGIRIGIKLAAVAFDDSDVSTTLANSGDHYSYVMTRDVTSYFTTNFGTGVSQTCQVGVAVSTATADSITNITCKLLVTYEYDDSNQSTLVKTVRIPLESTTNYLSDSLTEIGTNQIPDLDDFLPETTKSYKHIWFEVWGCEASTTTDNFNLAMSLDSESEATRATLTQNQISSPLYWEIWVRNDMTTTDPHAFKARATVASRMSCPAFVLNVTYTYDSSSTTIMNSLVLSLIGEKAEEIGSTSSSYTDILDAFLNIQEPATITLKQSGAMFMISGASITTNIKANSGGTAQSYRAYAHPAATHGSGLTTAFIQRIDSGSAVGGIGALVRGKNHIWLDLYANGTAYLNLVYLILNYTSGKASAGEGAHNHSVFYDIGLNFAASAASPKTSASVAPAIPETSYFLSSVGIRVNYIAAAIYNNVLTVAVRIGSGEGYGGAGSGWYCASLQRGGGSESGVLMQDVGLTQYFRQWPSAAAQADKLDIETARIWRVNFVGSGCLMARLVFTYHSITETVSGTISGSGAGTVSVYLHDKTTGELLGSTSRSGNGSYSIVCYDDTITKFADAYEDATHVGRSADGTV